MNEIFLLSTTPMLADCIEKFATSYDELRKIAVNHICQGNYPEEDLEVIHSPTRMMISVIEDRIFETEFHIIKLERV